MKTNLNVIAASLVKYNIIDYNDRDEMEEDRLFLLIEF